MKKQELQPNQSIRFVVKNADGIYVNFNVEEHDPDAKVALSMELFANSYIAVDNLTLTDYLPRKETDVYSMIVANNPENVEENPEDQPEES